MDEAAKYFDRICDELIDPEELAQSERPFIAALGRCCLRYRNLLLQRNAVDFAHLQVWAHRVMQDDGVAAAARAAVRHLMVDEFQDTSRVQMRILERLAGVNGNIVAVGDDDQSIYRFRGASVSNLLEFPHRFPGCRVAKLTTNYRSHRDIVAAVGRWMNSAAPWQPDGRSFRYAKDITPDEPDSHADYPAVISVHGQEAADEAAQLAELLRFLKDRGVIAGYGQAALLLHSVKDSVSGPYLDGLERAGVAGPLRTRRPYTHARRQRGAGHHHPPGQGPGVGRGDRGVAERAGPGNRPGGRHRWRNTSKVARANRPNLPGISTGPVDITWLSPGPGACWC